MSKRDNFEFEPHSPYLRRLVELNAAQPKSASPRESDFKRGFGLGVAWGFWVGLAAAILYVMVIAGFVRGGL